MSQLFIDEVKAIVGEKLSDENFDTKELAFALGLSSSQTLRKVKAATGKSINQYIREFRLEEAANLIKTTDHSISEISYKVGFSSPSYFNKAFSRYYKVAPGEYKTQSNNSETNEEIIPINSKSKALKKPIILAIAAVVICLIGYAVINISNSKDHTLTNSIAVLPFKDLSPEDTQWFCDGVSDNILHSLAQMKDLSVTSFTSSSTFRDSNKQIPQIAKELGVSYVLEGSVVLFEGEIKVITQLIDANDQHVWSKEYNDSFENVIDIQQNVAQEVIEQLQLTLSLKEEKVLQKYPTKNMEAYNLHMEGRRINQSTKYDDLVKNMRNNEKAIALDSNFVNAYVELAATKLVVAIEGFRYSFSAKEAMIYIDKALEIDPNSARGNAVKARLLLGEDKKESKDYFKKAIALNPNDAELRHWYAKYFLTAEEPDIEEALKQSTMAIKLSPFSSPFATRYAWLLILDENYDKAENFLTEYDFLIDKFTHSIFTFAILYRKNKSHQPGFDYAYAKIKEEPENAAFYNLWLSIGYDQIFIDKRKSVEFAKKAHELDAEFMSWFYFQRMTENGFSIDAAKFMTTNEFKNYSELTKAVTLWDYHYYKKDYNKAKDLIEKYAKDYIFGYFQVSRTYAQLGELKKLDSIENLYFIQGEDKYFNKAITHAILEERDSMYYYLNKLRYTYNSGIGLVNGSPEVDLYRNEERYKALLREQYIPVEGE